MTGLWDQFTESLKQKNVSAEELLHATEAELEEIFTENGYRALERAQLRTAWYAKKSQIGVADLSLAASATVVAASSREFAEAKVLLDHYVCPSPGMSVSIVELERVTNTVLQKRFERRKSELSGGVNGVVVRRFHSPVSCTNQKIQDLGFTLPADGPQMCLRFLTKAPASHPPGAYKLLLCDVAVGKYKAVSGDSTSITPEQLVSEAYDSVYLFYTASGRGGGGGGGGGSDGPAPSPGTVAATTPDEFLLFHPDQVLPRHVVTFLVHPALSGGGGSPSRSPPSPFSKPPPRLGEPPEAAHEVKRELSFQVSRRPPRHHTSLRLSPSHTHTAARRAAGGSRGGPAEGVDEECLEVLAAGGEPACGRRLPSGGCAPRQELCQPRRRHAAPGGGDRGQGRGADAQHRAPA